MPRNPKVNFDMLQLYFGEPYVIDLENIPGSVTVYSPTIGDIVHMGEQKFFQTLNIFICNTTQYRTVLWDLGIDWNTFPDFQLFIMLYKQIDPDVSSLLFGDLDFQKFVPLVKQLDPEDEKGEIILWNNDDEVEINENVWNHFSQYLRTVFGIFPEEKITNDDTLKGWYIQKDKRAMQRRLETEESGQAEKNSMQSVISACINHPGFKYKLSELREVGVAEFYDSVKRLQIYEQSTALLKGLYSGMIDGKSIKPEDYNFMRDI